MGNSLEHWKSTVKERQFLCIEGSFVSPFCNLIFGGSFLRSSLTGFLVNFSLADKFIKSAVAVELVHSASLLHDDVIDLATLRRHLPTLWQEKGKSASILTGDFLVSLAFEKIISLRDFEILDYFSKAFKNICLQEASQELGLQNDKTLEKVLEICSGKTGELFGLAALISSENSEPREVLYNAGKKIGVVYQLADDLADYYGNEEVLGKSSGLDEKSGKLTVMSLGLDKKEILQLIEKLLQEAVDLFEKVGKKSEIESYLEEVFRPSLAKLTKGLL